VNVCAWAPQASRSAGAAKRIFVICQFLAMAAPLLASLAGISVPAAAGRN
jgi:hypothetical protein